MSIDNLRAILKKHGLRITPQRIAVFNAILKSDNHPSVDKIYKIVSKIHKNISISTVYNILYLLQELGIIKLIDIDGIYRYDYYEGFHLHAICPKCNKIDDLYSDKIEHLWNLIKIELKFKVINQDIKIFRLCNECSTT